MCVVPGSALVAVHALVMDSVWEATATRQLTDVVFVDRANNGKVGLTVCLLGNFNPFKQNELSYLYQ